jgi:hypothetical protein
VHGWGWSWRGKETGVEVEALVRMGETVLLLKTGLEI